MKFITYDRDRDIPAESTPQGYYWVRGGDNGVWEVGEVCHITYKSGPRVRIERCGWDGGWVGPITLGPRVEFPAE